MIKFKEYLAEYIKLQNVSSVTKPGKMAGLAKKGDSLEAEHPDGTRYAVTVKRVGDAGVTVHNPDSGREEWHHTKNLYNAKGALSK